MTAPVDIIFSDENILAANKPSGLATIPGGWHSPEPNLFDNLSTSFGRIYTVHRLDKETSGIVIFARNMEAHRYLSLQFEHRDVKKMYHALVVGHPAWESKEIDLPLKVNSGRSHRTVIDYINGKPALTRVEVISRLRNYSLVKASPRSGYTHQIRAHMAAVGFPVLFDSRYGANPRTEASWPSFARLALHAKTVQFRHPQSQDEMILEAQFPADWVAIVDWAKEH